MREQFSATEPLDLDTFLELGMGSLPFFTACYIIN